MAFAIRGARFGSGFHAGSQVEGIYADPLVEAIKHDKDDSRVLKLLDSRPNAASQEYSGATLLYYAVASNRDAIAEVLLQRGADPNARVAAGWGGEGQTPIVMAVQNRNLRMLRLLIQHGADLNAHAQFGQSLAALAAGWPEGEQVLKAARIKHGVE